MQFFPFDNFYSTLRAGATASSPTFVDTSGTSRSFAAANVTTASTQYAKLPFFCYTRSSLGYLTPHASSAATIPQSTTTIPDEVGTTTVTYTATEKGWRAAITVTSVSDASVTHFVFLRKISTSSSNSYDACLFALKLDTSVTLNSANNHTANFTFEIEF